ncbi:hypothetical protein D3C76_1550690 [compost metagenome]
MPRADDQLAIGRQVANQLLNEVQGGRVLQDFELVEDEGEGLRVTCQLFDQPERILIFIVGLCGNEAFPACMQMQGKTIEVVVCVVQAQPQHGCSVGASAFQVLQQQCRFTEAGRCLHQNQFATLRLVAHLPQ